MEVTTFWHSLLAQFSQLTTQYPGVQTGLDFMAVILPLTLLLALPGLCVMALLGEVLAVRRQRSSYDKAGRQLAMLGAVLGWLLTLGGAALLYRQQNVTDIYPLCALGQLWSWLLVASGTLLVSLHFTLWRTLRAWPRLHRLLGLLAAIAAYLGAYLLLAVLVAQGQMDAGNPHIETLRELLIPNDDSLLWNAVYYLPALTIAMAGGLAPLWMLLRRKRDDYGRDHYNAMLPWAAAWARNAWLCLWIILLGCTAWAVLSEANEAITMPAQDIINHGIRLLLWLIPLLLWNIVARSAVPARHKFTLLLSQLLAMGFLVPFYMGLTWGY